MSDLIIHAAKVVRNLQIIGQSDDKSKEVKLTFFKMSKSLANLYKRELMRYSEHGLGSKVGLAGEGILGSES